MKQISIKALAAVTAALCMVGGAQAASTMGSGSLLAGTSTLTFELLSGASSRGTFSVYTTPGVTLSSLTLTPDGGAPFAVAPVTQSGFSALQLRGLVVGEYYTLAFTSPSAGGTFSISTTLASGSYDVISSTTPVPEAGTLALALAGLGVLGFLGRRRAA
jgi:MYXO-CTERM domain-containing protein